MKVAFLYPRIAHYREDFFKYFIENYDTDIYVYEDQEHSEKDNFLISPIKTIPLKSKLLLNKLRVFNFLPLISNKYDIVIIIGEMKVIPTWFILILLKFKKTKTILWGHGISIHKYLEEKEKLNWIRILYHKLADFIWLYTKEEKNIWINYINDTNIEYLNNTVNINKILSLPKFSKLELRNKYKIPENKTVLIFCARFAMKERRIDLLEELIKRLDNEKYYFIIIGNGPLKPDFSVYPNVLDFGLVYDENLKNELFTMSDLYYQPGWLGLSVNDAFAYGKPILSFKRRKDILQCVEYSYLNETNSFLAKDIDELIKYIDNLDSNEINFLSENARKFASQNLTLENMINRANNSLKNLKELF